MNGFFKFNLYDLNWNYLGEFWAATDFGLKKEGDYKKDGKQFIKRMA